MISFCTAVTLEAGFMDYLSRQGRADYGSNEERIAWLYDDEMT